MAKITIDSINEQLNEIGWKCVSISYKNLDTDLVFLCSEGHKVFSTWRKIRTKAFCPVCNENVNKQIQNISASAKKKGTYRVLAFDQSSRISGWSVFDDRTLVGYGIYESTADSALERIVDICDWMLSMIKSWRPDKVGFEETQYNPHSGMGHDVFKLLSQVMGAAMLTAAREKVEVDTVLIPTWRSHCGVKGNKRADQKRSAQLLVKKWYDITVSDDESDAICQGKYFSDKQKEKDEIVFGEWV